MRFRKWLAKRYLGSDVVYIGYNDQWIKWDSVKYEKKTSSENYTCDGEPGELVIRVKGKFLGFNAVAAKGPNVTFKGITIP